MSVGRCWQQPTSDAKCQIIATKILTPTRNGMDGEPTSASHGGGVVNGSVSAPPPSGRPPLAVAAVTIRPAPPGAALQGCCPPVAPPWEGCLWPIGWLCLLPPPPPLPHHHHRFPCRRPFWPSPMMPPAWRPSHSPHPSRAARGHRPPPPSRPPTPHPCPPPSPPPSLSINNVRSQTSQSLHVPSSSHCLIRTSMSRCLLSLLIPMAVPAL